MDKMKNFYKNKKIFITGVTGFKGSWLASVLLSYGAKIYGIGFNPNKNKKFFYKLNLDKKINLKIIDINNYNKLKIYINKIKPSIIFHLAAQPLIYESYVKPYETININTIGTLNILNICKNLKSLKSLICVTSDKCYKSNNSTKGFKEDDILGGEDPYSASKASAEIIINSYIKSYFKKLNVGVASARAGNVIGGGDWSPNRLIPDIIKSLTNNKKIIIRNPKFNRPWQHVLDPIYGYLLLAKKLYYKPRIYSGPYNFGPKPNNVTSVLKVVKIIIEYWKKGKYGVKKTNFYEQKNLQLNINKSKKLLRYSPKLSIKESIVYTAEWYKLVQFDRKNPNEVTKYQINKFLNKREK